MLIYIVPILFSAAADLVILVLAFGTALMSSSVAQFKALGSADRDLEDYLSCLQVSDYHLIITNK